MPDPHLIPLVADAFIVIAALDTDRYATVTVALLTPPAPCGSQFVLYESPNSQN